MSDPTIPQSVTSLSDAVHQRSRLAILSVLYELESADFNHLKRATGLSEGNLGKHLQVLESAHLIDVEKGYSGRKPQTILRINSEGIRAFENEVRVLSTLISGAQDSLKKTVTLSGEKSSNDKTRKLRPTQG